MLDKKGASWLIGLFEGDGNFQINYEEIEKGTVTKTKISYSINISLSLLDLEMLESIQKYLGGLGKIYTYPDRKEARFAIWKKEEVKWIIKNLFDLYPLVTVHQKERYARLRYGIFNNITFFFDNVELLKFKNTSFVTILNSSVSVYTRALPEEYLDNWILGIINSEGCFYTRPKKEGNTYLLVFQIEHTDRKVLEIFKNKFEFGPNIFERAERSIKQKKTYSLYISSKKDISKIVKFCELPTLNGLLGNKQIQYLNWKNKQTM